MNIPISVNGISVFAVVDTGSTLSHISDNLTRKLGLQLQKAANNYCVGLAVKGNSSPSLGSCKCNIEVNGSTYKDVNFIVLKDLVSDVILGQDFMDLHKSISIQFGGSKPDLHLGVLRTVTTTTPVSLFKHLSSNCKPIATKARRYSNADQKFISSELQRLLENDLIERNNSPWRAQPLVVTQDNHKKRMVIDYSQTINKFTQLDAYPLPRMQDVVNNVAKFKNFSTLDLTSAYHQIELPNVDRLYTAFQADGSLWQ